MAARVTLHPHGLLLAAGDAQGAAAQPELVPLHSGAVHYFRMAPEEWGRALDAMKAMGLGLVDLFVPWGVHEIAPEQFEWGEHDKWLDLPEFLRQCQARGLYVVLRPGPHINAELTYFGLPERIVWSAPNQARSSKQNPVVLPALPRAFPVPSYASEAFHEAAALWLREVARVTAPFRYPDGPIVMLQLDNEGSQYFRDGLYDQDYHPDAVRAFRVFLREKYQGDVLQLRAAWGEQSLQFATAEPPTRLDTREAAQLAKHFDWAEFHEHLLQNALQRFAHELREGGLRDIPTLHNLPPGEAAGARNTERLQRAVDLLAIDCYHQATPRSHAVLQRRVGELVARAEGANTPPFAAELGAGFQPFEPPADEEDAFYTLLACLAYGLRGFSLYMAVERDRWIGAPIDVHGVPRPSADRYRRVISALRRLEFHTLQRHVPVRLIVPRSIRRLARITHAFGPLAQGALQATGAGFRETCLELDFGLGEVPTLTVEAYLRTFERALRSRGVPYGYAGGEELRGNTQGASWVVCGLSGGIKPAFLQALQSLPAKVTVGPSLPKLDGHFRPLAEPLSLSGLEFMPLEDASEIERLVARRIEELSLPSYGCSPSEVHVCVHHSPKDGAPRVVFLLNPSAHKLTARFALLQAHSLRCCLRDGAPELHKRHGVFETTIEPRSALLFEVIA